MATNENNLDAYNEVATTLGGTGGHLNDIVAVRAIAVLEGVSGGPASILDDNMVLRLNAIDVGAGGVGTHENTLDALNSIVILKGGVGGHENDLDAINEWVDNAAAAGVLLVNMIAYWRLEEASGTRFDAHTNGLDLTDNNTVTQVTGKQGNAAEMVLANTEYLSRASESLLETGDIDYTFAFWWRPQDIVQSAAVFSKEQGAFPNAEYRLDQDGGSLRWFLIHASGVDLVTSSASLSDNVFFYVLVEHDVTANKIRIQVDNGTADEESTTGAAIVHSGSPFEIGRFRAGTPNSQDVDEFIFWKRLLTSAEKTFLFNSGTGRSFSEVQAFAG